MSELTPLLHVQEHDSAIDRLRYRRDHLDERSRLVALIKDRADLDSRLAEFASREATTASLQKRAEEEATSLSTRIETIEKQMYAGTVTAARDLQAMAHEVETLKERLGIAEEGILEIMEQAESLEGERSSLVKERATLGDVIAGLEVEIAEAEEAIQQEIDTVVLAREELARAVAGEMLDRYEALRKKLGGVAIAPLVHGRCEGCHLSLSSVALDRIRHAGDDELVSCDECGRMLVPQ